MDMWQEAVSDFQFQLNIGVPGSLSMVNES